MKKIYLSLICTLAACSPVFAQNTFPSSGVAGIGTNTPTSGGGLGLNMVYPFVQIKMEGTPYNWQGSELFINRSSSQDAWLASPNIMFKDVASNTSAIIQSYQGGLQLWSNGVKTVYVLPTNRVGIMAATPNATFQVESFGTKLCIGGANNTAMNGTSYVGFNAGRTTTDQWRVETTGYGGAVIYGDQAGNINFAGLPYAGGGGFVNYTDAQVKSRTYFQVTAAGAARAKVMKIELTGWSDYVFDKTYKLPSLQSVKAYIDKNHHLPDMPSAAEVIADGLNVGEVNKTLTKKVEEITLYLIEKDKQLQQQNEVIKEQQRMLMDMQRQYKRLAAKVNKR